MSEIINIEQGTQQDGDQQPITKKAKRDLETMEGMEENKDERDKVDQGKKTRKFSNIYSSDDADISLISSDNVMYKVHSYRLMTGSSVFRNMLSMQDFSARRDHIYLTDEKLERSGVLRALLDIMYTLETTKIDSVDMFTVLDLADKWDFEHVRHIIRRDLPHYDKKLYLFHRFQLSIKYKNPGLISGFLRREFEIKWGKPSNVSAINKFEQRRMVRQVYDDAARGLSNEDKVAGAQMFEAGTWSYGDFLLTPPTVLWALLRATHVGTTTPAKIDSDKVAGEFERLLTLAYKPKKADADKDKDDGGSQER